MSETKIRWPCPWCGQMPNVDRTRYQFDDPWRYIVQCLWLNCKVQPQTRKYAKRATAVMAWNSWGEKKEDTNAKT